MRRRSVSTWLAVWLALGLSGAGCVRSVGARGHDWWSAQTAHVRLQTDTGSARAGVLAEQLERQVQGLRSAFYRCALDDTQPIEVTVLAREDEAGALMRDEVLGGRSMHGVDGLLALPPRVVLADAAVQAPLDGTTLVSHELAHHYVDACFHDAPLWLHEGLASVFETTVVDGDAVVIGRAPYSITDGAFTWHEVRAETPVVIVPRFFVVPPSVLVGMSSDAFLHPVGPVLQSGFSVLGAETARRAHYASAFSLVHYLALGPDAELRARFVQYLSALSQGSASPDAAFAEAFAGIPLDERVERYTREGHYRVVVRPFVASDGALLETHALDPAEAHLRIAELELSAGGPSASDAARPHLELAAASPETRAEALLVRASFASPHRAAELVHEAERFAPEDRDVLRAGVLVAQQEGDQVTAIRLAARLADAPHLRAADLVVIAEVERTDGRLDEALAHARRAVLSDRGAWSSWLALARVARDREEWRTARGALRLVANLASHRSLPAVVEARSWIAAIDGMQLPAGEVGPEDVPAAPASYVDFDFTDP